ncbi:MAG: hypothetical protein NTV22_15780 [bacterium]|nr:hypothetical protein [bacterium]
MNVMATIDATWFDLDKLNVLVALVVLSALILYFIYHARRGKALFVRRIPGLESVEEAIGRATELGKPMLYVSGIGGAGDVATIAAMNILGYVAEQVAHYDTDLLVPCIDPVVMTIEQELVKNSYTRAGRPENYKEDNVCYLTGEQFPYAMAVSGIMVREKPAANFFMGSFAAESLILAEAGAATGAIQIAGTSAESQIPFFIVACDYTLIGEELFAASAYLSREPLLLGCLKGQDYAKLVIIVALLAGIALLTADVCLPGQFSQWFVNLFASAGG